MSMAFKRNLDSKSWEKYCFDILIHHFGWENVTPVPDEDRGDLGIEFFTSCGTIFQCYFPNFDYSMSEYKKHVQKKIRTDLSKLKENEKDISKYLDGTRIKRWVLLIPQNRSRELIPYCIKKARETLSKGVGYLDPSFEAKICTDETWPSAAQYARTVFPKEVHLESTEISDLDVKTFSEVNSKFLDNIDGKMKHAFADNYQDRIDTVIREYLKTEQLLDKYRDGFPNIHDEIIKSTNNNLIKIKQDNFFKPIPADEIFSKLLDANRSGLIDMKSKISSSNSDTFAFGSLCKWITECQMRFILNGK